MIRIKARGVCVRLGGAPVLNAVDCAIGAGEVVGLIGPNGAGKTTLLRALAGLQRPASGEIHVEGKVASSIDPRARARTVAYLPQAGTSHWAVTVETLVTMGRLPHMARFRRPGAADHAAVERALRTCDIVALRDRPMTRLSGGERARALLARAFAGEPKVLLADEPVAGLDPAHALDVMTTLRGLARDGAAVVIVLHDLSLAARFCDRLVLLHRGRVVASGTPTDVLSQPNLQAFYQIEAAHALIEGQPFIAPLRRHRAGGHATA